MHNGVFKLVKMHNANHILYKCCVIKSCLFSISEQIRSERLFFYCRQSQRLCCSKYFHK